MTTDTSRETVEGLAFCLRHRGYEAEAATMRALLAERDAAVAARNEALREIGNSARLMVQAEAERDAAVERAQLADESVASLYIERDEAVARGHDWCDQAQKMRRERDAARAEVARVKALLHDFVSSLWMDGPGADDIVRADALAAVKGYLAGVKHD